MVSDDDTKNNESTTKSCKTDAHVCLETLALQRTLKSIELTSQLKVPKLTSFEAKSNKKNKDIINQNFPF